KLTREYRQSQSVERSNMAGQRGVLRRRTPACRAENLASALETRWTIHHSGAEAPESDNTAPAVRSGTNVGSTAAAGPADRLGFKPGMVIQELGWDSDTDDELRVAVEDTIDADLVDGDYGNDVDAVLLWWRDGDGDLVDGLVDALTDLVGGGAIWLLTPKIGRPNADDATDIPEAAPIAGLAQTTTAAVSKDWSATRLVAPKTPA